jgi:predicted transcriptional regulator
MKTSTVNISFTKELLDQIDETARKESRSRSELLREAARIYIDRKKRWDVIFQLAESAAKDSGLTGKDVDKEIASYRKDKTK